MKISIASLLCLLALTVPATAQEATYSADSLMSAFDKGASLKGTAVTVHDVVMDNKNSRVTFRSSDLSRVICELDPATANRIKQPAVGSNVTVSGKVRGRGLLGNVTLDNCSLLTHEEKTVVPAEPAAQAITVAPPEIVSETLPPVLSPVEQPVEQPYEPARAVLAPSKAKAVSPAVNAVKKKDAVAPPKLAQFDIPPKENPTSRPGVPYGFYALLVLGGAIASSILSRLAAAARSTQFSRPALQNTAQIRQAALEQLLRKADSKR
jgi:hypothetical protein